MSNDVRPPAGAAPPPALLPRFVPRQTAPPVYRPSPTVTQLKPAMAPPPVYRPFPSNVSGGGIAQRKPGPVKMSPPPVYRPFSVAQSKPVNTPGRAAPPPVYRPFSAGGAQTKCGCTASEPSCKCRKVRRPKKHGTIQAFMMPGRVIQRMHSDSDYEPSDDDDCDETTCVETNCDLKAGIVSVRASFYPNGYRVATTNWKALQVTALQDTCGAGNYRCPGCATCKASGTATIDHYPETVVAHWNRIGKSQDRQDRMDFYNDTGNMRIRCGPCNHSGGNYDRDVTSTFSDTTSCT